jgi:hypothetical protein
MLTKYIPLILAFLVQTYGPSILQHIYLPLPSHLLRVRTYIDLSHLKSVSLETLFSRSRMGSPIRSVFFREETAGVMKYIHVVMSFNEGLKISKCCSVVMSVHPITCD